MPRPVQPVGSTRRRHRASFPRIVDVVYKNEFLRTLGHDHRKTCARKQEKGIAIRWIASGRERFRKMKHVLHQVPTGLERKGRLETPVLSEAPPDQPKRVLLHSYTPQVSEICWATRAFPLVLVRKKELTIQVFGIASAKLDLRALRNLSMRRQRPCGKVIRRLGDLPLPPRDSSSCPSQSGMAGV